MKKGRIATLVTGLLLTTLCASLSYGFTLRKQTLDEALADFSGRFEKAVRDNKIKRIGVSEFSISAGVGRKIGPYLSDRLTEAFVRSGIVEVVERAKLDVLIEEQKLGQTGLVDEKSARQVGGLLGIEAFVMGSYTVFDDELEISARMVDTGTGKIIKAATIRVPRSKDVNSLLEPLVPDKPLQLETSLLVQRKTDHGWEAVMVDEGGKLYSNDNIKLFFRANEDCYVYAIIFSADGTAARIFPHEQVNLSNRVQGGVSYKIPPGDDWFWLDDNRGAETIYIIADYNPIRDIDRLLLDMENAGSDYERRKAREDMEKRINTRGIGGVRKSENKVTYTTADGEKIEKVCEVVEGKVSIVRRITFQHL